jgi:para-nitrobenzyl esterase
MRSGGYPDRRGTVKLRSEWTITVTALAALGAGILLVVPRNPSRYMVPTADGLVSGVPSLDAQIVSFRGIPYAAPPVGPLRWRPPRPVTPWKGIRPADQFSASCVQHTPEQFLPWTPVFMTHRSVSEDCLYLNVWTPHASATADLPVIVFIHGGAFNSGAGSIRIYNGANLARTGLIVVTINYRVGIFGFFASPQLTAESQHHSSGNYGLLDQIAALRWVRRNIRSFGGDPGRITIWGQSAGAMSVEVLTLSPLAAGLFDRAQADSGIAGPGFPFPDLRTAEAEGMKYADRLGAHSLEELRAIPAAKLLPPANDDEDQFRPNIDGWVLPASLADLTANGSGSHVPLITGWQASDWLLGLPRVDTVQAYQDLARRLYGTMAREFLRLYPASAADQAEAMESLSSEHRDRVSMLLWAVLRDKSSSAHDPQPIYTYYFDRAIPWPQHPEYGAFHSGELPYFFRNLDLMNRPWQPVDDKVAGEVSAYLRNFATNGDPNGADLPHWPKIAPDSAITMQLGAHIGPMPVADPARLAFWKKYFAPSQAVHAPIF